MGAGQQVSSSFICRAAESLRKSVVDSYVFYIIYEHLIQKLICIASVITYPLCGAHIKTASLYELHLFSPS